MKEILSKKFISLTKEVEAANAIKIEIYKERKKINTEYFLEVVPVFIQGEWASLLPRGYRVKLSKFTMRQKSKDRKTYIQTELGNLMSLPDLSCLNEYLYKPLTSAI